MNVARGHTTLAFIAATPALARLTRIRPLCQRRAALTTAGSRGARTSMSGSADADKAAPRPDSGGDTGSAPSVADLRVSYSESTLDDAGLTACPIALFSRWMADAQASGTAEPNAMTLATADAQGRPSARVVLLKGVDERGFVWYTNYGSRKAAQLGENAHAALAFWWPELERSVRVEGVVARVSAAESDAYFASRPAESRLGAWASDQSRPLESREALHARWERLREAHLDGDGAAVNKAIERPPFWGGFRLVPRRIEFWKGRRARLHDRVLYEREAEAEAEAEAGEWARSRLQP